MFGSWLWGNPASHPIEAVRYPVSDPEKPAIKVESWVIFPNGCARKLSLRERWSWRRGKLKRVPVGRARMY